jgi:thioredoxin-related protein
MGPWVRLVVAALLLSPIGLLSQTATGRASGSPDLLAAVKAKDGPRVSKLLRDGADPNGTDAGGQTPLHLSAGGGDVTVTLLLVAAGATVNAKDARGMTPLHDAAAAGSRDVANILLSSGANPSAKSADGLTPAAEASRSGQAALADFLRSKEAAGGGTPQAGKARSYTDSDLEGVRRRNRLANEGQLAQAGTAPAPAGAAVAKSADKPEAEGDGGAVARAFDEGSWTEDIQAAERFSKERRHPLLALFTGSDWCHFCKQLEAQVLSTDAFREAVRGKYVLLYVDLPRKKAVPKEVLAERNRFAQQFSVNAFPTLVVLEGDRYIDRIRGFRQGVTKESYIAEIERIAPY